MSVYLLHVNWCVFMHGPVKKEEDPDVEVHYNTLLQVCNALYCIHVSSALLWAKRESSRGSSGARISPAQ